MAVVAAVTAAKDVFSTNIQAIRGFYKLSWPPAANTCCGCGCGSIFFSAAAEAAALLDFPPGLLLLP